MGVRSFNWHDSERNFKVEPAFPAFKFGLTPRLNTRVSGRFLTAKQAITLANYHASAAACGGRVDMAQAFQGELRATRRPVLSASEITSDAPGHACLLGFHPRVYSSCGHLLNRQAT